MTETVSLLGGLSYFEYQRLVCRDVLIPWLAERIPLEGAHVGDFGAHHGGMLDALRDHGVVGSAIGLELSGEVVESSPFAADDRFRLEVADVTNYDFDGREFDVVVLHDVLEHIPARVEALDAARRALRPGGHVFVSFPPYYSGFGGHQHLARGRARLVPFIHLLPERVFLRLARPAANEYMTAEGAYEDLVSVRQTKLTLGDAERAFAAAGLELVDRELFLIRPEHTVRYDVKTRTAGVLGSVPAVRELAVNGAFYLARRSDVEHVLTPVDVEALNDRLALEYPSDDYYERSPWAIKFVEYRRLAIIRRLVGRPDGLEIAEVGSGGGQVLQMFPSARLTAIDVSGVYLEQARKKLAGYDVRFLKGEADKLDLPPASYDRVICTEVLEHVVDPDAVLAAIARLLRPDGVAVITVPNDPLIGPLKGIVRRIPLRWLFGNRIDWGGDEYHLHRWSPAEFEALLSRHLDVVEHRSAPVRGLPLRACFACVPKGSAAARA
jgi:2-polyprenyl-3-methyl-5-hydroxy-6-metoxy-1,4-benzoquinol methylase